MKLDLSTYEDKFSLFNKFRRQLWSIVWFLFAKPFPKSLCSPWKRLLLRMFGAKIHSTAIVYSTARIYMPWNLEMDEFACLASEVDCYNVDKIKIGKHSTVSQKAYLCAASHDISSSSNSLLTKPIIIEDQVWIASSAFIGMGVTIGQGAVIGATASVYKDVDPWTVVGGNPAKFLKKRILTS